MHARSPFDNVAMPAGRPRDTFMGLFLPSAAVDEAQARVMAEIAALSLERNAWELDALGYTVLTPEPTGAGDLVSRMRAHLMGLFSPTGRRSISPSVRPASSREPRRVKSQITMARPIP